MEDRNAFSNDSNLKNLIYAKNANANVEAHAKTPNGFFRIACCFKYNMSIPAINRTNNEPYVIDLLIFSGMESKNPFVGVVVGMAVVGGETIPNRSDKPFIRIVRIQPHNNNRKNGSLMNPTRITNKFQKKLPSSQATNQLKNAFVFVLKSSQLLISNISNKEELDFSTSTPDELTAVLTEFKLNKMKMIITKNNVNNASRSLIRCI
jgi:hypothetical protein